MEVIERQYLVKTKVGVVDPLQQSTIHFNGKIILVRDVDQAGSAIESLFADGAKTYGVGMDMEWQPTFSPNLPEQPIALIQLSTENVCVIFFMLKIGSMPPALRDLLSKDEIMKIGVAVDLEDRNKLLRQYNITLGRTVDICDVATRLGFRRVGLANLSSTILGAKVNKNCRTSNWAASDLNPAQIRYAATDAFLSLVLYYKLRSIESVFIIAGPANSTIFTQKILTTDRISTLFSEFCSLIAHEKVYIDSSIPSPPVECPTCKATFRTPKGLDAHIKTDHTPINCEMCRLSLPSVGALFDHIKTTSHFPLDLAEQMMSGNTEYYCYQCPGGRSFRSITGAIQHYVLKHQVTQRRTKDPNVPTIPSWMPQVICNGYGLRSISFTGALGKLEVLCDSPAVALVVPGMALRDSPDPRLALPAEEAIPESLAKSTGSSNNGEQPPRIELNVDTPSMLSFMPLAGGLAFPPELFLQMAGNTTQSASASASPASVELPSPDSLILTGPLALVPSITNGMRSTTTSELATITPTLTFSAKPQHHQLHQNSRNHYNPSQHANAAHSQHRKRMHTQPYQPNRQQQYGRGASYAYNSNHRYTNTQPTQNSARYRVKTQAPNGVAASGVAQ